jgi:hypothetical protein
LAIGEAGDTPDLLSAEYNPAMRKFSYLARATGQAGLWLVTSSILAAVVAIWEHWRGAAVGGWTATLIAVFLLIITAYTVASREYDAKILARKELEKLTRRLAEVPKIRIVENSFKCDERNLYTKDDRGRVLTQTPIRSLVVQFINEPEFHVETANAREVIALAQFFNLDRDGDRKLILNDYPRWATNDDPEPGKANRHLLPTDIRIGESVELDLAVKYLHEDEAYPVTNHSYVYHALRHPTPLLGRKFLIVVTLSAVNLKEQFEFMFENLGKDKPLVAAAMRQVPLAGPPVLCIPDSETQLA